MVDFASLPYSSPNHWGKVHWWCKQSQWTILGHRGTKSLRCLLWALDLVCSLLTSQLGQKLLLGKGVCR